MSRLGKKPIPLPTGVTVEVNDGQVRVVGPKGEQTLALPTGFALRIQEDKLILEKREASLASALYGLWRALLKNAVLGVKEGFVRRLSLSGVGYRAVLSGEKLVLSLGFSHPVVVAAPEGITFRVENEVEVEVAGIDLQKVSQVAASIEKIRRAEPYKGKGITLVGKHYLRKEGKTGRVALGSGG